MTNVRRVKTLEPANAPEDYWEAEDDERGLPRASDRPLVTEAEVLALMQTVLRLLGARFMLLVAMVGSIVLAIMALQSSDWLAIVKLATFTLTVFAPTVWLSSKRAV